MKAHGKGILQESNIYFYPFSKIAKDLYYYVLCTGHYYCDQTYIVKRLNYDSYLLIYVIDGEGYYYNEGKYCKLSKGSFVILNCYKPHEYGTTSGWEILWIHFDGPLAQGHISEIYKSGGFQVKNPDTVFRCMEKIYQIFDKGKNPVEPLMNKILTNIVTEFLISSEDDIEAPPSEMEKIRIYITENLGKPLSLEELASQANLSMFYFTRLFRHEIGYTPHEYLIMVRINAAKFYLKSGSYSIKEIAFQCGFSNESGFCSCFKKVTGQTPSQFKTGITG